MTVQPTTKTEGPEPQASRAPASTPALIPSATPNNNSIDELITIREEKVSGTTPRRDEHRHRLETLYMYLVCGGAAVASLMTMVLIFVEALWGMPDSKKLAWGALGTITALLWTQAAKMIGKS